MKMKKLMSILVVMVLGAAALVLTDTIPLTVKGENVHETFAAWAKEQQYVETLKAGAARLMNEFWTAVDENDLDRYIDLLCHGQEPENREDYEAGLASLRDFRKQTKGWSVKSNLTQVNETQAYGEWLYYVISGNSGNSHRDSINFSAGLFGGLHVSGAAAFLEKAARENRIKEIITTTPFFIEY